MDKKVYLDHAATTYVKKEVLDEMMPYLTENYGNPSSAYKLGHDNKIAIEKARNKKPIETTGQLSEIINESFPPKMRWAGKNPSKRSFQAIRIAVNSELDSLSKVLDEAFEKLAVGGRFAIITFHSLEDRMVKQKFNALSTGCICPPEFPVCVCGQKPKAKLITRKPITASEEELKVNSRSHSAKLRVIEKI